jgi:hypothetical protein
MQAPNSKKEEFHAKLEKSGTDMEMIERSQQQLTRYTDLKGLLCSKISYSGSGWTPPLLEQKGLLQLKHMTVKNWRN